MQEVGLGRVLSRRGHLVTIYKCFKRRGGGQDEDVDIEPGLVIRYLPIGGIGAHGYLRTEALAKDLDGLLCFADNQIFLPHIYRFCKKYGICFVPYIGTAHSRHSGFHARFMNALFGMGTLKMYKDNPVIAKTNGARKELKSLGVGDIQVAPVGLDTAVLKKEYKPGRQSQLRIEFGCEADAVVLCSVARLEEEKRPLDLLELFMHIKDKKNFRLIVVGEGPLYQAMDQKIEEYGIRDEVKIINRIPYEEMWKIYAISDYFINLNRNEIFGMAIMEAVYYKVSVAAVMAQGPAITLNGMEGHCLCRSDQQIEDWLTGEYPSEDVLAESSRKMIQTFTWNRCADTFLNIVEGKSR